MSRSHGGPPGLGDLLTDFTERVDGVRHGLVVSSDGLLVALSGAVSRDVADQFAAVTAGLTSLTHGASACFAFAGMRQVIVEMADGYLFITSVDDDTCLTVIADRSCDMALVGYEMTMLADTCARSLTPELINQLRHTLPR